MTEKLFLVTHRKWTVEGDNYAGWSGYKTYNTFIKGEKKLKEWLKDVEEWNDPNLRNDKHFVDKVEEIKGLTDVTEKMLKAGKDAAAAAKVAERKMRAAELRAEARKIERGE